MDTVFKFLFEFLGQFFGSLWSIITGLFGGVGNAFDFSAYVNIINAYTTELGGLAWVIAIIAIVLLVAVLALCVWLIVVAVKKFIRSHRRRKDTDSLVKEVQALNKEVMRLNLEKDKILSMKRTQAKAVSTNLRKSTSFGQIMFRRFMTTISHFPSSVSVSDYLPAHSLVFTTILSLSDFLLLRLHLPDLLSFRVFQVQVKLHLLTPLVSL